MPALGFLAVVGLVLVALLFVADAILEKGPPPIITSGQVGLPERWHSDDVKILTSPHAIEPDMASPAVRDAQPKPDHDTLSKIAPAARAARAEVPRENNRARPPSDYQQHQWGDRFSIRGQ